jgi:hypothetical protein
MTEYDRLWAQFQKDKTELCFSELCDLVQLGFYLGDPVNIVPKVCRYMVAYSKNKGI